ncbi:hypothetical protein NPX79_01115 [Spiroplasma endosymbiont of Anurida maritima]|uniref:hypothetical protein n=1 Tax=Spiroplasma endosymbiont of Anurida maritima TaxID=2967972 RepID=UPI0036D251A2
MQKRDKNNAVDNNALLKNINPNYTRMYFGSKKELVGRAFILIAQALMMAVVFIEAASFSFAITEQIPIPAIFNDFGIGDGVYRSITVIMATFGIIISLVFLIPIFIIRSIRGVKKISIIYLTFGTIFTIVLLALSIVSYIYIPVKYNLLGLVFSAIIIAFVLIGSLILLITSIKQKNKLVEAIIESESMVA